MTFLLLLAAAALINGAIGGELRITSVDEFIQFGNSVNSGTNYLGTTVFLDSDLSLAGETFEPIGTSDSSHFNGTFDGQGHVISNLEMTSTSQYASLFGHSKGLTIKNVVLDSSCSITTSYSGYSDAYIGGIIGWCEANNGPCIIKNSVNMGSVTFSGDVSDGNSSHLGGIAGRLYSSSNHDVTVKNCANYGDVTYSGESRNSYIGGIAGYSYGRSSNRVHIYNSLNHGTITYDGSSNYLRLGGITGWTYYSLIENCVSGGKFSTPIKSSENYIGSIVGWVGEGTAISYTYFTSDLSDYSKYGQNYSEISESNTLSYNSTTFELDGTVSIGGYSRSSLIDSLNAAVDYYTGRDYSRWLLNKGKNAVSSTINGRTRPIKMDYQVILLPSLASEGKVSFDGWYTDKGLTTPLTEFNVTSETELYGKYCGPNITVTLDVNGGDELAVNEITVVCDRVYGDLPTPTRTEATFLGWFTEKNKSITEDSIVKNPENHPLYAHWSINNYALAFVLNNGDEPEVRALEFNEAIGYPADPVWVGYSFISWDRNITNMPANNTIITAQWTANNYTVTFNPSGGSVSQSKKVVTFGSAHGELPTPNKTGYTFVGWFTEKNESVTAGSIVNTQDNHTLYAHWSINKYTLAFVFNNGAEPVVRVLNFNESITYPANPVWVGYSFAGWNNNIANMPADNTIITAQWTANNYTVTFNPSGGSVSQSTKTVTFDKKYGDLPNATRKGYTFLGWFSEKNESITGESIVKVPGNHTLCGNWLEATQSQVEIVFSKKDMDKDEIEEVIRKYTDADFEITVIESNDDGIWVIVKFVDAEKANDFKEAVEASSEAKKGIIKNVGFVFESTRSFSPAAYHPMNFLWLI